MTENTIEDKIQYLVNQITYHSNMYYNGVPEIEDIEFDELVSELRQLDPNNHILTATGSGYNVRSSHLVEIAHTFHVGSLNKIQYYNVNDYLKANPGAKVVMPKMDGGSAVAYYDEGKLKYVLSRGDGRTGFDITNNVLGVPRIIKDKSITYVRGELAISYEASDKLGAAHPRNKAVGISQSNNPSLEEKELLKFIAYENNYPGKTDQIESLRENGFTVVNYDLYVDAESIIKNLNTQYSLRNSVISRFFDEEFPIDGLVFYDESTESQIAYKFPAEEATTTVRSIHWRLADTGRMVPVVWIEPVKLSGSTINKATANNYEWLSSRGIGVGAKVVIVRANEIIPKIVKVLEKSSEFKIPTTCPACSSELLRVGGNVACVNHDCTRKFRTILYGILSTFSPKGVAGAGISDFIETFNINTLDDLNKYVSSFDQSQHLEDLKQAVGGAKSKLFVEMIDNLNNQPCSIATALNLSNIPALGWTGSVSLMHNVSLDDFKSVIESGDIPDKWNSYLPTSTAFTNLKKDIKLVQEVVKFFGDRLYRKEKDVSVPVIGKVCITGKLSGKRTDIEKEFRALGYESTSAGAADILICDSPSNSSKYLTAVKRGIPIITETEFRNNISSK